MAAQMIAVPQGRTFQNNSAARSSLIDQPSGLQKLGNANASGWRVAQIAITRKWARAGGIEDISTVTYSFENNGITCRCPLLCTRSYPLASSLLLSRLILDSSEGRQSRRLKLQLPQSLLNCAANANLSMTSRVGVSHS
jgi:hypothetical protein